MLTINNQEINSVNKQFHKFSKKALKTPLGQSDVFVISSLQKFERMYKRLGVAEVFLLKAQQFAEDCNKNGLTDFTGIIYAFLIKIPNLPFDLKELMIKRGIEIARKQDDDIHELARVVDLKKLYKQNREVPKKLYIKTLLSEGQILKRIVRNYDETTKNYRTIARGFSDKNAYKFRLGVNLVDVAKAVIRTDKRTAGENLFEARKIFKDLKREKELFFVEGLIEQLNH